MRYGDDTFRYIPAVFPSNDTTMYQSLRIITSPPLTVHACDSWQKGVGLTGIITRNRGQQPDSHRC